MKTKHTPGPWQVVNDNALPEIREANSPFRVIADFEWAEDSASMRDNARLIAAAPELLEALISAEDQLRKYEVTIDCEWGLCRENDELEEEGLWGSAIKAARAAIAKATGDQP